MIQVKTRKGDILIQDNSLPIPKGYVRLFTTDTTTEDIAKGIVESYEQPIGWRADGDISKMSKLVLFKNYSLKYAKGAIPVSMLCDSALGSFISLLQSHDLDANKTYAICKKIN